MSTSSIRFPNESSEYRAARDRLLDAEIALRQQISEVAALRRELPLGGTVEDHAFRKIADGAETETRLSELFEDGKDALILYSYMYEPNDAQPCPMCTGLLDGLDDDPRHMDLMFPLWNYLDLTPDGRGEDWYPSVAY